MDNDNRKKHLSESNSNLPRTVNTKTRVGLKSIQTERKNSHNICKLESLISQTYNELALNNPKKDSMVEIKQQATHQVNTHCNMGLADILKEKTEILSSERKRRKPFFKLLMTPKTSKYVYKVISEIQKIKSKK